jgi:hypothetical protein
MIAGEGSGMGGAPGGKDRWLLASCGWIGAASAPAPFYAAPVAAPRLWEQGFSASLTN